MGEVCFGNPMESIICMLWWFCNSGNRLYVIFCSELKGEGILSFLTWNTLFQIEIK